MKKYLNFIINHPHTVLIGIAVITVICAAGLPLLQFESSLDSIMPKKDPEYIRNEQVKKIFGNNGKFLILCATDHNTMKSEFLTKFSNLHNDIEEYRIYNEDKENRRMSRLMGFTRKSPVNAKEILSSFKNDPVFQRTLKRLFMQDGLHKKKLSLSEINSIAEALKKINSVKKQMLVDIIVSPYTMQDVTGSNNILKVYKLIKKDDTGKRIIPQTREDIKKFEQLLKKNPAYKKGIYDSDPQSGRITDLGIMIRLRDSDVYDPIVNRIEKISQSYPDLNITVQGIPYMYKKVNSYMKRDLLFFLPIILFIVAIIFYLNFRTLRGVVLPLLTVIITDIWVLGLMGFLGYKLTIVGISLPPLMVAVGSSYSIHIMNQYYMDYKDMLTSGLKQGILHTMEHISYTVFLAGITTFIGFFMLITNQVSALQEWGVFSAIGVLLAVFVSVTLIPAVTVLLPNKIPESIIAADNKPHKDSITDKVINLFIKLSLNHSKAVTVTTLIVLAGAIAGMTQISVETSIHAYFKKNDPVLISSKKIGQAFGGSFGLNIIFDTKKKHGVKDPEFLKAVEKFRQWLILEKNKDLNIGRTDAFTDFIKTMHRAMKNDNPDMYKIPDSQQRINNYLDMYGGIDDNDDGRIDDFESYVDFDYQKMNLLARIWEKQGELISSRHMDHLIKRVNVYLDKNLPQGISYTTSGEPKIIVRLAGHVVNGQILSLLLSLFLVFLLVVYLFKNIKAGLVSLIPISVAVIINFGIMGWLGITLDIATAVIASITIGIGIDDTIHFLNTYKKHRDAGSNEKQALTMTLRVAGKAITYTSIALICGFLVLSISNFNPIILFGQLVAVTMIATTLGALLVLPAVLNLTGVNMDENSSGIWKYITKNRPLQTEKTKEN